MIGFCNCEIDKENESKKKTNVRKAKKVKPEAVSHFKNRVVGLLPFVLLSGAVLVLDFCAALLSVDVVFVLLWTENGKNNLRDLPKL